MKRHEIWDWIITALVAIAAISAFALAAPSPQDANTYRIPLYRQTMEMLDGYGCETIQVHIKAVKPDGWTVDHWYEVKP